ncbi:MAG: CapA family protein [Bacillota bacterium]|nr:CapA family protein [Bacillota bacterium]
MKKRSYTFEKFLIGVVSILLVACIALIFGLKSGLVNIDFKSKGEQKKGEKAEQKVESGEQASFTFMGVGDNLLHDVIFYNMDQTMKDIDYNTIYSNITQYTTADINYINYETICAGTENGLTLGGYPAFNGPTGFNDAVANAGFNWFSLCSNHTYDRGITGVLTELDYIKTHQPQVTVTGAYASAEEASTPTVVEINGIKVGLASYCYGFEGEPVGTDEANWMVNRIDENKIRNDLAVLNEVSDVQIVTMHWGSEYHTEQNEEQEYYANLLNELGVEVIIGAHPHVIEPVEWIHGKEQDTLCYYSLGNFISAQNANDNMIGGMANFKVTYNFDTKKATVSDATFTPTITYYDPSYNNYQIYTIHEWNDDLAASHEVTLVEKHDLTKAYVQEYVKNVMKNVKNVTVVLE